MKVFAFVAGWFVVASLIYTVRTTQPSTPATPVTVTNAAPCDARRHYEAGVWAGVQLGASAVQGMRPGVTNLNQLNAAAMELVKSYKE